MTAVFFFLRHSALRDKNRYSRKPRADVWSGVHGGPDKAGFLLLSLCLQTQAGELRERSVTAHQLHLPAGLWCYRQGLPNLRLAVVSLFSSVSLSFSFSSLALIPVTVFVTICCCVVPSPSSIPHSLLLSWFSVLLSRLLPPSVSCALPPCRNVRTSPEA